MLVDYLMNFIVCMFSIEQEWCYGCYFKSKN